MLPPPPESKSSLHRESWAPLNNETRICNAERRPIFRKVNLQDVFPALLAHKARNPSARGMARELTISIFALYYAMGNNLSSGI